MTRKTLDEFTAHLNSTFTFVLPGVDEFEATLVEAKAVTAKGRSGGLDGGYVLLFKSPDERVFAQNTFVVRHPVMGEQEIFIVPVGKDEGGVSYEAVFN